MNPKPLLWLLLAGCAAPRTQEPPPPLPAPSACPMGHEKLRPGPVGPDEIETFESVRPAPTGLKCARCGYGLFPGNLVWTREAASFDGFANPPSALLRRLHERSSDARGFTYTQKSAGKASSETLTFTSAKDLWPILLAELDALGARGGATEKGLDKSWKGLLGDLELIAYVDGSGGRSHLLILLRPPVPPGEFERAFKDALRPR